MQLAKSDITAIQKETKRCIPFIRKYSKQN